MVTTTSDDSWLDRWQRICGWCFVAGGLSALILKFGFLAAWCTNPAGCGSGTPYAGAAAARIPDVVSGVGISLASLLVTIGMFGIAAPFLRGRRKRIAIPILAVVGVGVLLIPNALDTWWMHSPWIAPFHDDSVIAAESQVAVASIWILAAGLFLLRPTPSKRFLGVCLLVGAGLWTSKLILVIAEGTVGPNGWHILLFQVGTWLILASSVWIIVRAIRTKDLRPVLVVVGAVFFEYVLEATLPSTIHGEAGLIALTIVAAAAGLSLVIVRRHGAVLESP